VRETQGKQDGVLPSEYSYATCHTPGVIVETVKRAESGDGVVLRMYEAYKERKQVELSIPNAREAILCDLSENELQKLSLDGGRVALSIKPFEIITLKIQTR
jgi:alpha-mannosidase